VIQKATPFTPKSYIRQPSQGFTFQKYVTKGHHTAVAAHSTVKRLVFAIECVATAV
jgi:hypothetical protein